MNIISSDVLQFEDSINPVDFIINTRSTGGIRRNLNRIRFQYSLTCYTDKLDNLHGPGTMAATSYYEAKDESALVEILDRLLIGIHGFILVVNNDSHECQRFVFNHDSVVKGA